MFTSLVWLICRLAVLTLFVVQLTFGMATVMAQEMPSEPTSATPSLETPPTQIEPKETPRSPQIPQNRTESPRVPTPRGQTTYPKPPHRYNMKAIEKFDEELYGE